MRTELIIAALLAGACGRGPESIVGQEKAEPAAPAKALATEDPQPEAATHVVPTTVTTGRGEAQRAGEQASRELGDLRRELERATFQDRTQAEVAADAALATQVRFDLGFEERLRDCAFEASAIDGIVILRGRVPSTDKRTRAIKIASAVRGVKRLIDHLEIKPSSIAATPKS